MFLTLSVTGNDSNKSELSQNAEYVVRRYAEMVYRIAMSHLGSKYDADDVFQEVFFAYYKKQRRFNEEEHRKAWLIKTTVNCSKKANRLKRRANAATVEEKDVVASPFEIKEETELWTALLTLPEDYRTVIELFYFEGMSAKEIGAVMGAREGAVHTKLSRARKLLEERLKGES